MVKLGGPIPLPNAVLGARSGLGHLAGRPLDLGYGINVTGLPFGILALHGDLGWLAIDQHGVFPAVTVRNKLFWSSNFFATKQQGVPTSAWAVDEVDVFASWKLKGTVIYGSLGQVFDFGNLQLNLVPALGASIDFGKEGGLTLQPEVRWWAIDHSSQQRNVQWVPANPGAIGIHLGVAHTLGRRR